MDINQDLIGHWHNIYTKLSNTVRFSTSFTLNKENVAAHSFFVAYITMMLCDLWNKQFDERADTERALKIALLHDVEESMSGDIITSMKYRNPDFADMIRQINIDILHEMFGDEGADYIDLWKEKKNTLEGRIVELADVVSLLSYVGQEVRLGNKEMEYIFHNALKKLNGIKARNKEIDFYKEVVDMVIEFYSIEDADKALSW